MRISKTLACLMIVTAQSAYALQPNLVSSRCKVDSLSQPQGLERVVWFETCHKDTVVRDMREILGVPNLAAEEAIKEFRQSMRVVFAHGEYRAEEVVVDGKTKKLRVQYPLFLKLNDDESLAVFKAPRVRDACDVKIPDGFRWRTTCTSGCYTPQMNILFSNGTGDFEKPIVTALDEMSQNPTSANIVVVANDSSLDAVALTDSPLKGFTRSAVSTDHDIKAFRTQGGGYLEVTPNHPMVDQNGVMREASTFAIGDSFVRLDGQKDAITSITDTKHFGKVYNIEPESTTLMGHIIVAQGFLTGSVWYQNDGVVEQNRVILRGQVPTELVD